MLKLITDNLFNPPVLFFVLGIIAVLVKSDLELPGSTPKVLALYLLFSIGLHGGVSLAQSGISLTVALSIVAAVVMSCLTTVVAFVVLRPRLGVYNAAAIGATYGSVSAVTFMTAGNFLTEINVPYNGHMVAALAFMESPAIVAGLLCLRVFQPAGGTTRGSLLALAIESLLNGSVFLLLGSLVIGYLSGESGWDKVSPFAEGIFGGALCLFLLDMGLSAGRGLGGIREAGLFPVVFALVFPFVGATAGILVSKLLGFDQGDALLFTVLCASASYIAVPAVMKTAVPAANPGLYVPMALGLTFPLNILVGIPLYHAAIQHLIPKGLPPA
jgi:hypothetical protein